MLNSDGFNLQTFESAAAAVLIYACFPPFINASKSHLQVLLVANKCPADKLCADIFSMAFQA